MIVIGKASKGGSTERAAKVLELAAADLDSKLEGSKVSALAVYEDSVNLNIVAVVDNDNKKQKKS